MADPQWLDVSAPTVQLRVLTWGPADAPIALAENAGYLLQLEQPDVVARHIVDSVGRAA